MSSKLTITTKSRQENHHVSRLFLALVMAVFAISTALHASTVSWKDFTTAGTFTWSTGGNWIDGAAPATNDPTLIVNFDTSVAGAISSGGQYDATFTANNDLGTVQLNQLNFSGGSTSGGAKTMTITGNELAFYGSNATLTVTNTGVGTKHVIENTLSLNTDLAVDTTESEAYPDSSLELKGDIALGANTLTLSANPAIYGNIFVDSTASISGSGDIIVQGERIHFRGVNSSFTGDFFAEATLTRMNSNLMTSANTMNVASGTTLALEDTNHTWAGVNGAGEIGRATNATRNITLGGSAEYSFSGDLTDGIGSATGLNNLIVNMSSDSGKQTFTGANTYSGTTQVQNGILNIQNGAGLGNTTGGTTVSNDGTLQLEGGIVVGNETLTFTGAGATGQNGALVNVSGNNTYGGVLTMGGSPSGDWISSDSGHLDLTNTATITNTVPRTLNLTGAGDGTLAGSLEAGWISKSGTGTWTLTGTNTYSGATNVTAGTLELAGSGSINGTSGITVSSGATLEASSLTPITASISLAGGTISGSGTIGDGAGYTLTIADGYLNPGSSPGNLTIDGDLVISDTLQIEVQDDGTFAIDSLTITGNLNITGATLELIDLGGGPYDYTIPRLIAEYQGDLTGSFASIIGSPNVSNIVYGADFGDLSDGYTTGIYLSIPEPASLVLLVLGATALFSRRQWKKN